MSDHKLSATGKLFFASVIAYLAGSKSAVKLKATPEQIKSIADILKASKALQDSVKKPDSTIEDVIEKMRLKNLAIAEFGKKFNKPWPL